MKSRSRWLAPLLFAGTLVLPGGSLAVDANAIRAVDVQEQKDAIELSIRGSRPPSYSVFKLQDPPRLVIDMAGADVTGVASRDVHKGGVLAVSAAQYKDQRSTVGRVIVSLDGPQRYEVTSKGDDVVVRVLAAGADAPAATPAATAAATPEPEPEKRAEPVVARKEEPAPAAAVAAPEAAPVAEPAPAAADDHVTRRRVETAPAGGKAAHAVTAVRAQAGGVLVATDGQVPRVEVLELRDPPRLALDLQGVSRAPRSAVPLSGPFTSARFGRSDGKVRVVLDAAGALPEVDVKPTRAGLVIALRAPAAESTARAEAPKAAPAPVVAAPAAPAAKPAAAARPAALARVGNVKFTGDARASRIEITGKTAYAVERPDPNTLVLTLDAAELPHGLERSLDTSAFQGPVVMVSSFNQPSTHTVKVVAAVRGAVDDAVRETPHGLVWQVAQRAEASATAEAKPEPTPVVTASGAEAAGFAAEAPGYAAAGAPKARGYSGRHITLDFHDIEIRNLLRLIADVSKKNIVVADDVAGRITVSLRDVPWDQALDLVLAAKGLGKEETGNVIRIAKLETITKEQQARADAEKARQPLIPVKVRIIPVNFARVSELSARVKDVLSDRGTVSTDERTNVLIVKDVPEAITRAEGLVRNLDAETPQVLIEARIVEAQSNYNRALGVQWGGTGQMTQAAGNPTGFIFPNNIIGAGAAGGAPADGVTAASPNYAVNLPAAIGPGSGGGLGFTFGSIGGAFNLNLRLSALENSGMVKTISAPKISTIDNKEATISQGTSIPFSQTSASGTNTTFIDASLELKVTPHVSADGTVLLKIKASNNAPNPGLMGANQQPSINKREAQTEVLVKDGDTTVIGGIFTRQMSNHRSEVPWLGKIPVLGYFFRTTTQQDDHTELLIFITPRILNRPSAATSSN